MKNIAVLGSTGFVGSHTLDVVARFPDRFSVVGLAAGANLTKLAEQIRIFNPSVAAVADDLLADRLRRMLPPATKTRIVSNQAGIIEVATVEEADLVVSAIVGASGLLPTMAAIRAAKTVALANKETL
ncbi:MAG TPA: 1-deoxy-D-xylulose-5-phosphate reductoisomerase, partial [Thermodesulfobacteriota bacterium]|nr:1-deoxy-D-xylulose-5-phosphate reductoisomerase [Thermodesulfobacteriota bacterium]